MYWTVLIFILIYFEWRDTENQQLEQFTNPEFYLKLILHTLWTFV